MKRLWDVAKELVTVTIIASVAVEEVGGQGDAIDQIVKAIREFKDVAIQREYYNSSWWLDFVYSDIVLSWIVHLLKSLR